MPFPAIWEPLGAKIFWEHRALTVVVFTSRVNHYLIDVMPPLQLHNKEEHGAAPLPQFRMRKMKVDQKYVSLPPKKRNSRAISEKSE